MKILITGATGFIGTNLVERLAGEGHDVRAFSRSQATFPPGVLAFQGDICDADAVALAMEGCEAVVHLAAKVHDLRNPANDEEQWTVTLEGTRTVVALAARRRCKLVFLSTLAVYGLSEVVQDEETPPDPSTDYGRAKLACELLVQEAGERFGLDFVILRPAMVYGPGCKGNLPRLIRAVSRGVFAIPSGADNRRSVLHVHNLTDAICLTLSNPQSRGRTYVVTDNADYSTRAIIEMIARAMNRSLPILRIPYQVLHVAAVVADVIGALAGRRLPFGTLTLQKLTRSQFFSSARIQRELGYSPRRTLEQSISEIADDVLTG